MGKEIERKYLVKNDSYKQLSHSVHLIRQGYLSRDPERTVRIRISDSKSFLTIKGKTEGISRLEFEYGIPLKDAEALLGLCDGRVIVKKRWKVMWEGKVWEVDEFLADLYPLVVAEIELKDTGEEFALPPFIGEEVSDNPAYFNSNL